MGLKEEKESISFSVLDTQYSIIPPAHYSSLPVGLFRLGQSY
jgi:hypothetical protein